MAKKVSGAEASRAPGGRARLSRRQVLGLVGLSLLGGALTACNSSNNVADGPIAHFYGLYYDEASPYPDMNLELPSEAELRQERDTYRAWAMDPEVTDEDEEVKQALRRTNELIWPAREVNDPERSELVLESLGALGVAFQKNDQTPDRAGMVKTFDAQAAVAAEDVTAEPPLVDMMVTQDKIVDTMYAERSRMSNAEKVVWLNGLGNPGLVDLSEKQLAPAVDSAIALDKAREHAYYEVTVAFDAHLNATDPNYADQRARAVALIGHIETVGQNGDRLANAAKHAQQQIGQAKEAISARNTCDWKPSCGGAELADLEEEAEEESEEANAAAGEYDLALRQAADALRKSDAVSFTPKYLAEHRISPGRHDPGEASAMASRLGDSLGDYQRAQKTAVTAMTEEKDDIVHSLEVDIAVEQYKLQRDSGTLPWENDQSKRAGKASKDGGPGPLVSILPLRSAT